MDKPWKLVLLLVGIFAAGAVAGGFGTHYYLKKEGGPKRPPPEQWGSQRLKTLEEKLGLNAEQKEKLGPIVQRNMEDLARIRNTALSDTRRILERMEHDIGEILTPEQKVKFEQLNKEMRERFQKMLRVGVPRRERPPEGQPAPEPPKDKPAEKPADK